jgi:FkbH-like protein
MKWDVLDLPWLSAIDSDFRNLCKSAELDSHGQGYEFQRLANQRLGNEQLLALSRSIRTAALSQRDLSPLFPFRLAILGNGTTSLYTTTLEASGARHGILLDVIAAPYDQVVQESLDVNSTINTSKPDAILLSLDARALPIQEGSYGDKRAESEQVEKALQHIQMIRNGLLSGSRAPVIYQTIPRPPLNTFGNFANNISGTYSSILTKLNERIRELASSGSDYLFDVASLAENIGLDRWHDAKQWNLYKLPFSQMCVPLYSDFIARLIAAIRGKAKKCLILDLDNTIWGGVIGDDGLCGIQVGQGNGLGEAFLNIQRTALSLRERGILLAICSKNDDKNAREPFLSHPEMLLKLDHIAAFRANWNDKASNIESIAKELNLGLDSFVFLDDSPFERAQVRQALPMVAVPELSEDPSYFSHALLSAGYFETTSFTQEDSLRANQYQANAMRQQLISEGRDLSEYLNSLEMKIQITPFDDLNLSRIVQLINKTNQFNLTTRRYTEAEVVDFYTNGDNFSTFQVRVQDIYGDYGMIGVVICRIKLTIWDIDTWLMSCRVLGRCVEYEVLNAVVRQAIKSGATELIGHYIPTQKNGMVNNLFSAMGFECFDKNQDSSTHWRLKLKTYQPFETALSLAKTTC